MEQNKKSGPFYIRVIRSVNPQTEKLIKEQLNPAFTQNPHRIKKELVKKVRKSLDVDSSYYLG